MATMKVMKISHSLFENDSISTVTESVCSLCCSIGHEFPKIMIYEVAIRCFYLF